MGMPRYDPDCSVLPSYLKFATDFPCETHEDVYMQVCNENIVQV